MAELQGFGAILLAIGTADSAPADPVEAAMLTTTRTCSHDPALPGRRRCSPSRHPHSVVLPILLATGRLDELHLPVHPIVVRKDMLQDRRPEPRLWAGRVDRRRHLRGRQGPPRTGLRTSPSGHSAAKPSDGLGLTRLGAAVSIWRQLLLRRTRRRRVAH
jgi:hypothetical protein